MSTAANGYENASREELLAVIKDLSSQLLKFRQLEHELNQLKRLAFGSRHERFVPAVSPDQLALGLNAPAAEPAQVVATQQIQYTRTQVQPVKREGKGGRMKLPANLPREQIIIEPDEDVTGFKRIGEEVTEELEYEPGKFFVRQIIRPKYARPQQEEGRPGVVIGQLPARIIEKGIAGPGLIAQVMVDKYVDHLPLFRQNERFKRAGISFPMSTLSETVTRGCQELEPLYEAHRGLVLSSGYLEGDETTIKVLDKDKKGKTHLGYYWVYRAPLENLVLFDYRPGRSREGPMELLKDFKGYLQTDGYDVYDYFGDQPGITLVGCMAHARRKFHDALANDKRHAEYVLTRMQELYAIERKAKDEELTYEQRYDLRQQDAVPILKELEQWMKEQYGALEASVVGKAIAYSLRRWEKLCLYTTDGRLQIDNNLVENAIRPVAIGRKNYLFAGSHKSAQRAATLYSLFGTCKINNINPYDWLRDVFSRIATHPINKIEELLPHRWVKN